MEHLSENVFSSWGILISGLPLRDKIQTRKLFSKYRIRKMEMGVLKGYSWMIKFGACFHSGEIDIYVTKKILYLVFLCTRANMR